MELTVGRRGQRWGHHVFQRTESVYNIAEIVYKNPIHEMQSYPFKIGSDIARERISKMIHFIVCMAYIFACGWLVRSLYPSLCRFFMGLPRRRISRKAALLIAHEEIINKTGASAMPLCICEEVRYFYVRSRQRVRHNLVLFVDAWDGHVTWIYPKLRQVKSSE